MPHYAGPIRGEPLAIELHNTLYAHRGDVADGLADDAGMRAWLAALGDRLPVDPGAVDPRRLDDLRTLREAVREGLHAALEGRAMSGDALAELNRWSAGSSESLQLVQRGRERRAQVRHHAPTASDVALGAIASSAIALVSGPDAGALRACGAPGCVLAFLKDHPRREWCSPACGNRARQARHYARSRARR